MAHRFRIIAATALTAVALTLAVAPTAQADTSVTITCADGTAGVVTTTTAGAITTTCDDGTGLPGGIAPLNTVWD